MTKFVKWHSIENSYRQKEIDRWLNLFPQLVDEMYVVTEKIHGSNFQWFVSPDQTIHAGSRNNWLDISGRFQGVSIEELYFSHEDLLLDLQDWVDETEKSIRLFGELFGQGIQKGVDYGKEKRLLYFGMMIDDELQNFDTLEAFIGRDKIVPVVGIARSLQEALNFDTDFDSILSDKGDNICEGVVIQPVSVYFDYNGSPFILKKKNEKFGEKQKAPKEIVVDTDVQRLNLEFRSYINDSRLQSVFSKEGEIQSPQEIGKYIRLILEDAKGDFLKDFGDEFDQMDKGQQRNVLNVGSTVANMLKEYL